MFDLATTRLNWSTVEVFVSADKAYSSSLREKLQHLIEEAERAAADGKNNTEEEGRRRKPLRACAYHE